MEQALSLSQRHTPYFIAAMYVTLVAVICYFVRDPSLAAPIILFIGALPLLLKDRRLLAFVLLLSFTLAQTPIQALNDLFYPGRWLLLGAAALIAIFHPIAAGKKIARPFHQTRWIWFFLSLAVLSATYSVAPLDSLKRALSLVTLFFVTSYLIKPLAFDYTPERILNLFLAGLSIPYFISTCLIPSNKAYTLAEQTYQSLEGNKVISNFIGITPLDQSFSRFHGVFTNPNTIGLLTCLALPLVLQKVLDEKKKTFYLLLLFMMILNLLLSGSREGLFVSMVSSIYILCCRLGIKKLTSLLLFGLLPLVIILFPLVASVIHSGWLYSYLRLNNLVLGGGRVEAWLVALPIIQSRPLLGHGFGTEQHLLFNTGYRFLLHSGGYVHNSYLGLIMQVGVVGALLFFIPLFHLFFSELKVRNPSPTRVALQGVLLSGLLISMTESWIYSVGNAAAYLFWSFIALLEYIRVTQDKKAFLEPS